ncbi:MAG TPA: aldehyde dehydrogenase [Candidatus Avamphibacillus sp.]|nr:aldehyde dehydrogenase [Candidatus Avamphibacillus sp.]
MKEIKSIVKKQKEFFFNHTFDYDFRINQLNSLKKMLENNEEEIYQALRKDLNKSPFETLTTELGVLYGEIDVAKKNLKEWMKPKKVRTPITHKGTKSYIYKEAYGVTLIISAWNYPIQLSIAPLIGAIAAGNTAVIKPSEFAANTSSLLASMFRETFSHEYIAVIEGEVKVSQALLEQPFDYIFFTGSSKIGKIIMEKASQNLIPIAWGKFTNAGQTCVAPDYVYVHHKVKNKFMRALIKQIKSLYGKKPLNNKDYVQMIHQAHFERIESFLKEGKIIYGGNVDKEKLLIEPTLLNNITWNDSVMQEEIFGPVLPILTYESLDNLLLKMQRFEKPLVLYYFGENESDQEKVVNNISFGGGSINDTLYHLANPHLPFGGVGSSGMGAYHGKYSFDTFSHEKAVMKQTTKFDMPFRYPGSKLAHSIVKKVMG